MTAAITSDERRRRELLRSASMLGCVLAVGFVVYFVIIAAWMSAVCVFFVGITYAATLATARRPGRAFTVFASMGFMCSVFSTLFVASDTGGAESPLLLFFNVPPMVAYFSLGFRGGTFVFVASALVLAVIFVVWMPTSHLDAVGEARLRHIVPFLVLGTMYGVMFWMERARLAAFEELRVANIELATARDEAQRASRAKSEFVATVSHELRTPLSAIMATTDLLLSSSMGDEQRENVRVARDAAGALAVLVDDLLDLSRLDASRLELHAVPTDVVAITRSAAGLLAQRAAAKGIALDVDAPDCPPRVLIDGHRLRQIVTILVDNAVKFTPAGRVHVTVRTTPKAKDAELEVTVADTGIGVPPALADSIFERFRQGDSSPTRRYGGAGLGLTIARDLARLMGGDVKLVPSRSEPSASDGATFRLTLVAPLVADDAHAVGLAGRRILVAEDNAVNQRLAALMLQSAGAVVDVASDGLEALRLAGGGSYDLVLMDLYMPQMDGFRAAAALRARGCSTPIVALTAAGTDDDKAQAKAVGMNGVLKKPIDVDAIREALQRSLVQA